MFTKGFQNAEFNTAFGLAVREEVGADAWFVVLHEGDRQAVLVSEAGALIKISLPPAVDLQPTIAVNEYVHLTMAQRIEVLHGLTEAQRTRSYLLKRANKTLRASLLRELRALRGARQMYDTLVEQAITLQ